MARWYLTLTLLCVLAVHTIAGVQVPAPQQTSAPRSADSLLAAALKQARADGKNVFVEFGASWCGPCLAIQRLIGTGDTGAAFSKYFVIANITVLENGDKRALNNPGGLEIMDRFGWNGGIPFWFVVTPDGAKLADSYDSALPPSTPDEVRAFSAFIEKTAPKMTPAERSLFVSAGARVARSATATGRADRWLWTAEHTLFGARISPDARFVPFINWSDVPLAYRYYSIYLHDLRENSDRRLISSVELKRDGSNTDDEPEETPSAFSRDSRYLAFVWRVFVAGESSRRFQLRVADIRASGVVEPRVLINRPDIVAMAAHDWTPDGQSILVDLAYADGVHRLCLVSAKDGEIRVLKTLGREGVSSAYVSPDGYHVAFDTATTPFAPRDIFLVSLKSGGEISAVAHRADDVLLGWSPDGNSLAFATDRGGLPAIWSVEVHGALVGKATMVKAGVGNVDGIGLTPDGSLYHVVGGTWQDDIRTVSVDLANGQLLSGTVDLVTDNSGANTQPLWSPDGKLLAYRTVRSGMMGRRETVFAIRENETGRVREYRGLGSPSVKAWAPDGTLLLEKSAGLYALDLQSGRLKQLAQGTGGLWNVLPRAGKVYFTPGGTSNQPSKIVEQDLASGVSREIYRGPANVVNNGSAISPDGRILYTREPDPTSTREKPSIDLIAKDLASGAERVFLKGQPLGQLKISPDGSRLLIGFGGHFLLVDSRNGSSKEITIPETGANLSLLVWAVDGQSILAARPIGTDIPREVWWIPLNGGTARKLDVQLRNGGRVSLHPDGRQLAFEYYDGVDERQVWVFENLFGRPNVVK